MTLAATSFDWVRGLVHRESAIVLQPGKEYLVEARLLPIARSLGLHWQLDFDDRRDRVAIFCSKEAHCLYDLLLRQQLNELRGDVVLVISNNPDNRAGQVSNPSRPTNGRRSDPTVRRKVRHRRRHRPPRLLLRRIPLPAR